MTIYTPAALERKDESSLPDPEVCSTLTIDDKERDGVKDRLVHSNAPRRAQIAVSVRPHPQRQHAKFYIATLCILIPLGITVGGIILYKYIHDKPVTGWCGVEFYEYEDEVMSKLQRASNEVEKEFDRARKKIFGTFKEEFELDVAEGRWERLKVPAFLDFESSTVLHDFDKNITCIVNRPNGWQPGQCYILPLNRSLVVPPKDMWDLLKKLRTGYYMPDVHLVRKEYRVLRPAIQDIRPLGLYVWKECEMYKTYKLQLKDKPYALTRRRKRRDAHNVNFVAGVSDKAVFGISISNE